MSQLIPSRCPQSANTPAVAVTWAEAEDLAPHGEHARQRELQPQREQQERHPELGQQSRRARIRQHTEGVRSEHQPDHEISNARR